MKGSYNRSSILLLSWTFEVWYLHWLDHASLGSDFDFERLMNLSRVKPAILSSKWVLVVKPHTVGDTGTVDTAADLFAMQNYFVEEGHFQDYFTLGRIDKYV